MLAAIGIILITKQIPLLIGYDSPDFWQEEFFDHVLRSKESYAEKWDYVRDNPVRAGWAKRAEDWPYAGWVDFR